MTDNKQIIDRKRIRKINGSFSWVSHKLITGGFLEDMSTWEILLYFFLVAVCDRNGISFYHDDRICRLLKIDLPETLHIYPGGLLLWKILITGRFLPK